MQPLIWFAILAAALVSVAAVLRWRRPTDPGPSRVRLRRTVLLFLPYAALTPLAAFGHHLGDGVWLAAVRIAAEFLALLLAINLAAVTVFDISLPALRLRAPDILHDLSVGVSYVVALVWLMHRSGVNLASIVATSAVVTAVIGLSLQSTLGSVIGGLALQVDSSFGEGDWVELESKVQGQVKQIRWRHTVIETRDWDTLLVPNNQLLNQTIRVLGKRGGASAPHRMWVHFQVDYRTPPHEVIRTIDRALQIARIDGVALSPPPNTVCLDLGRDPAQSSARYAVRYHLTDLARDDPTSSLVRERVFTALQRAEIPLAIPAGALFMASETAERKQRKERRRLERIRMGLSRVALFSALTDEERDELARSITPAPFVEGETVMRQGAKAHSLYLLMKGRVAVEVSMGHGKDKRVRELNAPDFFGEMALMTGAPREASVVALTDLECLRVDRSAFAALIERRPEMARELADVIAERRVAVQAALEHLDETSRDRRVEGERSRILNALQDFFGLEPREG